MTGHGIVMDMNQVGVMGRFPFHIPEFIKHQTLTVRIVNHISAKKATTNGVPQGSVLSVTLFALK